jgi:hypothetical protein
MESFSDLEEWDKPDFEYGMRPIYKRNHNGPKELLVLKATKSIMIFLLLQRT